MEANPNKNLKIKIRKQHGSQSNDRPVSNDLARTFKDSTNTAPNSSTSIRNIKVKKFGQENKKKLPQQKICYQVKNSNSTINLKDQRKYSTTSNGSSIERKYRVKNSQQETKRVWKIKKKEEPVVEVTEAILKPVESETLRKTMTYIEKKDIETDLSLKNGPPDFQVFSSEKRISKKQRVESDDDLECEENICSFKSPEKLQVFNPLKDSANVCTQLGAENVNVNARVSVFVEPSLLLLEDLD